ncbi:CLP1 kinase, partial [Acromyrmex heyeri]
MVKSVVKEFKLDPNDEFKFQMKDKSSRVKVTLELKSGLAEIFGMELIKNKKYNFVVNVNFTIIVYTWQGCTIAFEFLTKSNIIYFISNKSPMSLYLNCHAALEQMRETAEKNDTRGPITMIVKSRDVGKSALCTILLNYAVRIDRKPIFVDLDINQGHIAIPGTVGASLIERPYNIMEGFNEQNPLVFHFGDKSPEHNLALYTSLITRLAVYSNTLQNNKKVKASGVIINIWVYLNNRIEENYKLLMYAGQVFEVDVILVTDQILYNKLVNDMPHFVKITFLPQIGRIKNKNRNLKIQNRSLREQSIREYFYGFSTPLYPHSFEVKWDEMKLYKIEASNSSLMLSNRKDNLKLKAVTPGLNLLYHLLSVSFVDSPKDDVLQTNVAGFVCVINVNVDRKTFTILSPQPRPLPNTILLLSNIEFRNHH